MNSQGKMKIQVWMLILLVFLLGGLTGGALDRLVLHGGSGNPGPPRHGGSGKMVEMMKRDLNITAEQEQTVRAISEESRQEFKRLAESAGFKQARERSRARIREILTPEQQKKFDEINAQRDADTKKREAEQK